MNAFLELKYGGEQLVTKIDSKKSLIKVFDDILLHFEPRNPLFDCLHHSGAIMYVGVSPNWCWTHYVNIQGGYFVTSIPENGEELTWFSYGGHYTEVMIKNCVKYGTMLEILYDFFETGEINSTLVTWVKFTAS